MVDWEITATTIYCDAVDDEVTILVYRDFSTKCTAYPRYAQPDRATTIQLRKKAKQLRRRLECAGLDCPRIVQYKQKLLTEEESAKGR